MEHFKAGCIDVFIHLLHIFHYHLVHNKFFKGFMWWRTRSDPLFCPCFFLIILAVTTYTIIPIYCKCMLLHKWYMTESNVLSILFRSYYKWPPTIKHDLLQLRSTHQVTCTLHVKKKVCLNVVPKKHPHLKIEIRGMILRMKFLLANPV